MVALTVGAQQICCQPTLRQTTTTCAADGKLPAPHVCQEISLQSQPAILVLVVVSIIIVNIILLLIGSFFKETKLQLHQNLKNVIITMSILQIALQKMIIFKFMLTGQITVLYTKMTTLVGYNFTE